eukprot:6174216-Pleurochrysis_carterae.AAC.1
MSPAYETSVCSSSVCGGSACDSCVANPSLPPSDDRASYAPSACMPLALSSAESTRSTPCSSKASSARLVLASTARPATPRAPHSCPTPTASW